MAQMRRQRSQPAGPALRERPETLGHLGGLARLALDAHDRRSPCGGTPALTVSPSTCIQGLRCLGSAPDVVLCTGPPSNAGAMRLRIAPGRPGDRRRSRRVNHRGGFHAGTHCSAADFRVDQRSPMGMWTPTARRCGCRLARSGTHAPPKKSTLEKLGLPMGRSPVIKHLSVRDFGAPG